ncbi:hypothetical protein MMC29_003330 [Sticta canariensis]|nr:hypothetical protein [Sticta canariensis]
MPGPTEELPEFDEKKAYAIQEDTFFDDGREIELLHFIYSHPSIRDIRGSPTRLLEAIDEFARTKKYLMNVGDDKGKIVVALIEEVKPQVMVELGGYIGYSALLFGDAARKAGGRMFYSLERNAEFAAVIMSLLNLAGLDGFVKVIVGPSADSIGRLYAEGVLNHIDLMFLDHWKPAYTTDLKLCEQLKLITPGTVLAADNCIKPGNPPYLEYVRSSVREKRKKCEQENKREEDTDAFASRYKDQYIKSVGVETLDTQVKGNPKLIYESKMIHSFEPSGVPDGIEITRCVGEET